MKTANHKKVNKLELIKTSIKKTSSRKQIGKDMNLEYIKNHKYKKDKKMHNYILAKDFNNLYTRMFVALSLMIVQT